MRISLLRHRNYKYSNMGSTNLQQKSSFQNIYAPELTLPLVHLELTFTNERDVI